MPVALPVAAFNLVTALTCGAVIGSERQVRQRMAGLRTNALVALGAAGFVTFSQLQGVPDTSPSRVAAQVVSGIGFLGAGIIFRDGFEIHGINTAATLWCSAAVGLLSATGQAHYAVLMTGLVVFVNLGLRPLVKLLKRYTAAGAPIARVWTIHLDCKEADEGAMRALTLRTLTLAGLHLHEIQGVAQDGLVALTAQVTGEGMTEAMLDQTIQRLAAEPGVVRLRWNLGEDA
jgi:putative Mg2+ transporter-C (MgtC) family protein